MHSHEAELAHDVEVIIGSILITTDHASSTHHAGEHIDIDWAKPHQIMALEANTTILNTMLNGIPPGYESLPPEELEWEKDIPKWHLLS